MPWSERKPKLPSTKEAPVSVAACRALHPRVHTPFQFLELRAISTCHYLIFRLCINARSIPEFIANASISCRQRRVADMSLDSSLCDASGQPLGPFRLVA